MSIKFKLALPLIAGLVLSLLLINLVWQPLQLERAKFTFKQHTKELLDVAQISLIKHLLERDLGAFFSRLEQLETSQKDIWFNFTLYNNDNKRLYPIFKENSDSVSIETDYIHITYPLRIEGTNLGYLELDVDWGEQKRIIIENLDDIRDMVIWIILMVLSITTLSQYQILYRPLKKLDEAVNRIKQRDYDVVLPEPKNDEIGKLTNSFDLMLIELKFQDRAINQHAIVSEADKNGVITNVNDKFVSISGYTRDELIGKTHRVVKSNTHSQEFYEDMWGTITSGEVWHGEICNWKKNGEIYWVSATIVPFLNVEGVPERYISIRTDITERKAAEAQLSHLANHDSLTGLPTRRLGKETLSMALTLARRDKKRTAVMFIDLDGFKAVNDTLGHNIGDLLLIEVAERLTNCVRELDEVIRVGGDEFMVILSRIDNRDNASMVAQKIIDSLEDTFSYDGKTATVGASIGIALYPDHAQEPDALIKCADEMMYAVKRKGKNSFAFYDDV